MTGARRIRIAAAALLTVLAAPSGGAAEAKIGYIDSARIFQEYKPAQEAQAAFDRQVQTWRAESAEKERVVSALRAEVRDQGPILSAVRRQEREEALQRAISEYERFVQDIWGPQGRAAQENERVTAEIVAQIRSAVEKVAGERDLDLVLDSAGGLIVYADRSLNLTDYVLAELANRAAGTTR
uniref:OmpH family outer membrane protein n=1 Tax=Eiseniibacteriota bacterium TaxID=2212470 RepID=A0A832I3G6_UNCEI